MSLEFKIKQEDYNAVLKRKEVQVEVDHDEKGTPSRIDLRKAIAAKYGTKPENVYVMDVETRTGTQRALCEIQVYDDPEDAKRTVPKYVQIRNLPPEERKQVREQQAKKAEAKTKPEKPGPQKAKEEKPKEGKKEAKPAEPPKKGKEGGPK